MIEDIYTRLVARIYAPFSPGDRFFVGYLAVAVLLAPMLGSGSLATIACFLCLALFTMGFVYGPLGAWLPDLFPARVRYTGASLAFNIGGILGGGVTPLLAQALAERGGLGLVGLYLGVAASRSLVALLLSPNRSPQPGALSSARS